LALLTISGCGEADPVPTDGTRIRVVETYGAAAERSVTLTALFSSDVAGATEVSDVKIEVKPTGTPLVQKLETLLEDAGFRWRSGQKGWPELLRTLPPEAIPMVRRLQLALLLLDGPDAFEVDRPHLDLLSASPSLGLTRVARRDGAVALTSLALVLTPTGSRLVWGHAAGQLTAQGVELVGTRFLESGAPEVVTTLVTRIASSEAAAPAGR